MFTKRQNEEHVLFILRWSARIFGLMVMVLLLLFILGEPPWNGEVTPRELVGLLFFPVGLMLGYAVAWKHELAGGLISLGSVAGFYFLYGLVLTGSMPRGWAFPAFAIPGVMFLLYGLLLPIWFPYRRTV